MDIDAYRYYEDKFGCYEYSEVMLQFPEVPAGTVFEPLTLTVKAADEVNKFKIAHNVWLDKTQWVQETEQYGFTLGMHRADALRAIIEKQSAALKLAMDALVEVQDLIRESHGVYGLHLNGDESPWGELEQGGRFERLTLLNEALAAIDALEGE